MPKTSTTETRKNPAAVALGKRRAATLTAEHQSSAAKSLAKTMSADEKASRAKAGAAARWKGHKKKSLRRKSKAAKE